MRPMLVFTEVLYGGLNQVTRRPLRVFFWICGGCCEYLIFLSNPLFLSASLYVGAALLNISSSEDRDDMRFSMASGICLSMVGGWFEFALMYVGVSLGIAGGTFKERHRNHTKSFRNIKYEKETELSKYIWALKKGNVTYTIKWETIHKSNTNRRQIGHCNLCMAEKLAIITHKDEIMNRKTEILSKCRHNNYKPPDRTRKK